MMKHFSTGFVSAPDSFLFYSNSLQPLFKISVSIVFEERIANRSKKNCFEKIIKGWSVFMDIFPEMNTRLLWGCKIILEISFLMICYLTKFYVVIQIPPHNLCKTFDDVIIIIQFLVCTLQYSKAKLKRKDARKS